MTRPTQPPEGTRSPGAARIEAGSSKSKQFFEEQHRRLSPGLRRLFLERSAGRQELAEELAQKCWSLAWQALAAGKYDSTRAAYSTFVYAIAQNVWLQFLRSSGQRQNTNSPLQDEPGSANAAPEETAKTVELVDLLRAVLRGDHDAQLNEEERWIVRAVAQGETDRGLAAKLKLSPSTANARKNAAFDKLRRFLATQGHRDEDERAPTI